jgi:hypothetical protein
MTIADHRRTASCGFSKAAQDYRELQQELIDSGHYDDALNMDIQDIETKFGSKYDTALFGLQDCWP